MNEREMTGIDIVIVADNDDNDDNKTELMPEISFQAKHKDLRVLFLERRLSRLMACTARLITIIIMAERMKECAHKTTVNLMPRRCITYASTWNLWYIIICQKYNIFIY